MVSKNILKIDKLLKEVTLWVHPEGPVSGSLFVQPEDEKKAAEAPDDVLNQDTPFVVLKSNLGDDVRFYNRAAIVRATYPDRQSNSDSQSNAESSKQTFQCKLLMMDGSMIQGHIRENLQPEYARLYDYLNKGEKRFIKIDTGDEDICLINKSYIIQVTELA